MTADFLKPVCYFYFLGQSNIKQSLQALVANSLIQPIVNLKYPVEFIIDLGLKIQIVVREDSD